MGTHAKLSPSKRTRWALCPGSVREAAKYPEPESGPAAIDGTHSHTLLERCVGNGLCDPTYYINRTFSNHEGEFAVDADRAARVKVAIDYIKDRMEAVESTDDVEILSETKVNPKWFFHRDDLGGTVDLTINGGGVLEIVDYKDGVTPVEVVGNLQLEQYAIGKIAECNLGWNVPEKYPWREVRMTIIQPKLAMRGLAPISTWTVPIAYLLDRLSVLSAQAAATDDPNAPLVPGETQCRYCPAKGSCAAKMEHVMEQIGFTSSTSMDMAEQMADKDPTSMSNGDLTKIMLAAPMIRQLLEGAEEETKRRMEAGQLFPDLKLVSGRGSRKWAFSDDEMAETLVKMGIPKGSVYETKLVSPAKAEKLTWTKRDGTKMTLTDRQLKRMEKEYVVRLAGNLIVVPESDSRKAVSVSAAPMFDAVVDKPAGLPAWLL